MNDEGRIEELKKKLYSNSEELPEMKRPRLREHRQSVNQSWQADDVPSLAFDAVENFQNETYSKDKFGPKLKVLMLLAIIFFLGAAGFATYWFMMGANTVSSNNIDIKLVGPVTVPAGETLTLDVDIFNNNSADLELVDLVVTYPEGTRKVDDRLTNMITDRVAVGTIPAKGKTRVTIKSLLFGEELSNHNIKFSVEFRFPGSTQLLSKDKDYPITIGNSPVALVIDSVKEITPNQETVFDVSVTSNSAEPLKNLVLQADYPNGFSFVKSDPKPSLDKNIWHLGDFAPGEAKKIKLTGMIMGQTNEAKNIRFNVGTAETKDPNSIAKVFKTVPKELALKKPFLGADFSINDSYDPIVVVKSGYQIKTDVGWQNNLDVPINDAVIELKLTGAMLDKSSVQSERAYYKSGSDTLIWDKNTLDLLEELASNSAGKILFTFATVEPSNQVNSTFRRPELKLALSIKGKRLNEERVPEQINASVTRTIRIESDLYLKTRALRSEGPFANTGPMPTKVDTESTYTVLVRLSNSYNNVKGVVYKAKLPPYVRWTGEIYPATASSSVYYNDESREVTWNLGDIAPGTGFSSSPKEFAYKIGFTPSISHKNKAVNLIFNQEAYGQDAFTGTVTKSEDHDINTEISTDPRYEMDWGKVEGIN